MFIIHLLGKPWEGCLLPQPGTGPSDVVPWTQIFPAFDDFAPLRKKDQGLCVWAGM